MPVESKVSLSVFNATIKELTEAISKLKEQLDDRFGKLDQRIEKECSIVKDTVIRRLQEENAVLREKVRTLENRIEISSQYERRNNITIDGIPPDIPAEHLENKVIQLCSSIGVDVKPDDIEACHPLSSRKSHPTIIVRFVNRKHAEHVKNNRRKLKNADKSFLGDNVHDKGIYINPHLTEYYSKMSWMCRRLRKKGLIVSHSSSGELLKIFHSNGRFTKIKDMGHIESLFPDFDFTSLGRRSEISE